MTHIKTIATKKSRASDVQVTFTQSFQKLGVYLLNNNTIARKTIDPASINSIVRYGEDEMEKMTVSVISEHFC